MVKNHTITLRTKKILIIDDEPQFCEDLIFFLEGLYKISIAYGSAEGMRLVKEVKPDIIILDLSMPIYYAEKKDNEGVEVLKRLKQGDTSNIPVLILSKIDSQQKKAECISFGADSYLTKPPSIHELVDTIEALTGT